jgi:hypothetical protein
LKPPDNGKFSAYGAAVHDEKSNCWAVGVVIRLGRHAAPANIVYFPLFIGENNRQPTIRIGWIGDAKPLDLENAIDLYESFDSVMELIKGLYGGTQSEGKKGIGIHA